MKSSLVTPGILLFLLWTAVSCDPGKVTDQYHPVRNAIWDADTVFTFPFNIARSTENHNIWFNIRNDNSYEFSNLWLFVTISSPRGEAVTDTVQVMLAEPSGKWMGRGFSGIYDNQAIFRRNVFFPESGAYTIQLKHGMRPARLKGITDIGIRIEKIN